MTGSSGANPFACIAAGIAALWGPSHGGANEAVLEMLQEIGDESNIDNFVAKAKDKNDPFRLMGFGHRVYKNFDPRAKVMKETADEVLKELGLENDPLLKIAKRLEKIALEDPYFVEKKLYPNVDFYSGIILKAIGIPTSMFTVIFAVGRTVGWIAHWNEMHSAPYKIGRPRQLYTGEPPRDYVSLDKINSNIPNMHQNNTRPVNLQLQKFSWPITAIASITHRICAVIVWFGLGVLLVSVAYVNESPMNYERTLSIINSYFIIQFILWSLLSAMSYYCIGTIKHLIQEFGYCEDFKSGKIISWLAISLGILLSIFDRAYDMGIKQWIFQRISNIAIVSFGLWMFYL